eukprot:500670-Pyramimonas_sp.AAC.1
MTGGDEGAGAEEGGAYKRFEMSGREISAALIQGVDWATLNSAVILKAAQPGSKLKARRRSDAFALDDFEDALADFHSECSSE